LPPLAATNLSYSALMSASVTGFFFLEVGKQLTNQNGLAGQFDLGFVVVRGVQAALFGFLHEDFAGDQLLLDLVQHFRRDGAARGFDLLLQRFDARRRNWLAVDHGQVLRQAGDASKATKAALSICFFIVFS
jgi:hypothetical protein